MMKLEKELSEILSKLNPVEKSELLAFAIQLARAKEEGAHSPLPCPYPSDSAG